MPTLASPRWLSKVEKTHGAPKRCHSSPTAHLRGCSWSTAQDVTSLVKTGAHARALLGRGALLSPFSSLLQ